MKGMRVNDIGLMAMAMMVMSMAMMMFGMSRMMAVETENR